MFTEQESIVTMHEQNVIRILPLNPPFCWKYIQVLQYCLAYIHYSHLIISNVMHNCLLPNYTFSFEQMITKRGRITKWCSKSNMVEPKFALKSFHPSSFHFYSLCHIYVRDRENIMFRCPQTPPSIFYQPSPNLEEYVMAIQGVTEVC